MSSVFPGRQKQQASCSGFVNVEFSLGLEAQKAEATVSTPVFLAVL